MKYTFRGQIFSVILTHFEAALVFFLVWALAISITGTKIGGLIYSSVSAFFYTAMIYSCGNTAAKNDKKSYSKLTPIPYKGAILALGLLALNIIFIAFYKLSWAMGSLDGSLVKLWAAIGNAVSLFWFSPYMNLLGMNEGAISFYGYAIIILLHIAACFFGYFAGFKGFDVSSKFSFLVYEKKKKDR